MSSISASFSASALSAPPQAHASRPVAAVSSGPVDRRAELAAVRQSLPRPSPVELEVPLFHVQDLSQPPRLPPVDSIFLDAVPAWTGGAAASSPRRTPGPARLRAPDLADGAEAATAWADRRCERLIRMGYAGSALMARIARAIATHPELNRPEQFQAVGAVLGRLSGRKAAERLLQWPSPVFTEVLLPADPLRPTAWGTCLTALARGVFGEMRIDDRGALQLEAWCRDRADLMGLVEPAYRVAVGLQQVLAARGHPGVQAAGPQPREDAASHAWHWYFADVRMVTGGPGLDGKDAKRAAPRVPPGLVTVPGPPPGAGIPQASSAQQASPRSKGPPAPVESMPGK